MSGQHESLPLHSVRAEQVTGTHTGHQSLSHSPYRRFLNVIRTEADRKKKPEYVSAYGSGSKVLQTALGPD
jgi:hypothetical protein